MSLTNLGSLDASNEAVRPTPMLVCATAPERPEPEVVLADGVYETGRERIFWRGALDHHVLRLPLDVPVSTRQVRAVPLQRQAVAAGERALLRAVQVTRRRLPPLPDVTDSQVARAYIGRSLSAALEGGDSDLACAEAVRLWRHAGLAQVYRLLSEHLAALPVAWGHGTGTVLAERRATRAATQLVHSLSGSTPRPRAGGTVVLAVPEGDQHTTALWALQHLLSQAGHASEVVGALPRHELAQLAAEPSTTAIVLSVHRALPAAELRALLGALRTAAPGVLVAVGGPGLPPRTSATWGATVITTEVDELLAAIARPAGGLTAREVDVLTAVADGLTNAEIAQHLGVAATTVKSHLDHILAKTGTSHRAAAVARALRQGWIG